MVLNHAIIVFSPGRGLTGLNIDIRRKGNACTVTTPVGMCILYLNYVNVFYANNI